MGKQLILQPAGKGAATIHYRDTIANPVLLARIKPFLSDDDFKQLSTIYPGAAAPVWGVTPGENDRNRKRWERINPGDIALFAKKGKLFSVGEVSFKVHNKPLALELWKVDAEAKTWEYVYFLQGTPQGATDAWRPCAAALSDRTSVRTPNLRKRHH